MRRPPRPANASLFERAQLLRSLAQGLLVVVVLLGLFAFALHDAEGVAHARTLTFAALIVVSLALILANRSWSRSIREGLSSPNVALWWVLGGALMVLALALGIPIVREAFRFSSLHVGDLPTLALLAVLGLLVFRWINFLGNERTRVTSS